MNEKSTYKFNKARDTYSYTNVLKKKNPLITLHQHLVNYNLTISKHNNDFLLWFNQKINQENLNRSLIICNP